MAVDYPTYPVTTLAQAEDMIIFTSNQIHDIMNADATSVIEAEDGQIPSIRKALVDNMYFKTPQIWVASTQITDPLQLKQFTDGGWYFAPTATVSTPVNLGATPIGDTNWKPWSKDQAAVYQHARRLAAEAGYNMVSGSFYFGGTLNSTDDVLFYEGDGKYYSWSGLFPKVVSAGSTPATSGGIGAGAWVDRTDVTLKPYVDRSLSDLSTAANKFYPTLAEANADIANINVNQPVTVGAAVNGGLWYKATVGATTLTKSAYDPLTQAKVDATTKANAAEVNAKNYTDIAISDYTIQKTQSTKNKFEGDESFKFGVPYSGYVASYYIDVPVTEGQKVVLSNGVLKIPSNAAYLTDTGEKTGTAYRSQIPANKYGGAFAILYTAAPATAVKLRLVWLASDYNFDRSMFQLEVIPVGSVAKPSPYEPPKRFQDYISKFDRQLNVENIKTLPEAVINSNNYYDQYNIVGPYLASGAILSNLIPTVEGDKWYMQRPATTSSYWFYFYDSNLVQLAGVLYPYATAPAGAAFVCGVLAATGTDSAEIQAFNSSPAAPVQIEKSTVPTPIFPRYKLSQVAYLNNVLEVNNLKGKHLYALGDSITQAGAWLGACDMLGMTYKNFALSGWKWAGTNNIKTQIDSLESWMVAGNRPPDIIGIALGTNDWGNSSPIGDYGLTMAMDSSSPEVVNLSTVLAAIKYSIMRLRTLSPNAFIFMITPLQRSGKYDYTYIQAVKDGARMMSVPCMDAYAESGMNAYDPNSLTKYFSDGLHTTNAGNKKYSGYVAKKLCQIYAVDQV